jgi:hypothetical protein
VVHSGDMWTDSGSDLKARIGVCRGPNSTYWVRGSQTMNRLYPLCHAGSSLICGRIQGDLICGQIQGHENGLAGGVRCFPHIPLEL